MSGIDQSIVSWFIPGIVGVELKHGDHDQSTHGHGGGGVASGRKQPTVSGDVELSARASGIIDKLPDALVPPYKSISVERSGIISQTNNNKVSIGSASGMDSDAVLEHEILHISAPKYKVDYPKEVQDAGNGQWSKSMVYQEHESQGVTEDFVGSAHAYLSETRGFNGPTFSDAKRSGLLDDHQIEQRRKYFKRLMSD